MSKELNKNKEWKQIRKIIYKQIRISTEREIIRINQVEILEVKSALVEIKNSLEGFYSRFKQADGEPANLKI